MLTRGELADDVPGGVARPLVDHLHAVLVPAADRDHVGKHSQLPTLLRVGQYQKKMNCEGNSHSSGQGKLGVDPTSIFPRV